MRAVLASWWRSDSHQHRFDSVLGEYASKRLYTVVFGILFAIYATMWAGTLLTPDGPTSESGRAFIAVSSVLLAVTAAASFAGWLPPERFSLAGLVALDIALVIGSLQLSSDLIGLLILFMYGPVGFLIGFRHGPKALTLHCIGAVAAIAVMTADCMNDPALNPITTLDVAVGLTLLVAGLPLASHIVFDVYRIRAIEAELDPLTDLLNRRGLRPRWYHMVATARPGDWLMVICTDLDAFKPINDTHGHRLGDIVLRRSAEQIIGVVGPGAHVARTGGDEFTALMRFAEGDAARRLRHVDGIRRAIRHDRDPVAITASVGLAAAPFDEVSRADPAEMLRLLTADADTAMYAAKRLGGDRTVDASAMSTEQRRGDAADFDEHR